MKKFTFTLALTMAITLVISQPAAFKYQAVVRDAGGAVISNQNVSFRISIVQDNINGTVVYTEDHNTMTNEFGLANLKIGNGTPVSGTFNAIDWGANDHFLQISLDITGGINFALMGSSQLLSVPYALHSRSSEILTGELTVAGLSDVDLTGLANGKVLKYNSVGEQWIVSDDLNTTYTAGVGLNLAGGQFSASFAGNGAANTISRSDHNHFGQIWSGSADNGLRVINSSTTGHAITGFNISGSGITYGIFGSVSSSNGLGGYFSNSTTGIAVGGFQTGYSVGDQNAYWAPGGMFGGRNGIIALSKTPGGYGVIAWNKDTSTDAFSYGLWAQTDAPNAYCGRFNTFSGHGVYISTPAGKTGLIVTGGSKNAAVPTTEGTRLLYTEESTEVWFTDYGFGQLQKGVMVVAIDPLFAQTVNLDEPYHVFTEVYGPATIYVTNLTTTHFEVHLHEGQPDVKFSYRIVGKRLGYEDHRLEHAPEIAVDPIMHPGQTGNMNQQPWHQDR
jgi:hypothetical protein